MFVKTLSHFLKLKHLSVGLLCSVFLLRGLWRKKIFSISVCSRIAALTSSHKICSDWRSLDILLVLFISYAECHMLPLKMRWVLFGQVSCKNSSFMLLQVLNNQFFFTIQDGNFTNPSVSYFLIMLLIIIEFNILCEKLWKHSIKLGFHFNAAVTGSCK